MINAKVREVLEDLPRCGAPAKFTAEQVTRLIALACEKPEHCGRPISHWTPRELAEEAVSRGIFVRISTTSVRRFLAAADLQPHRIRYGLNACPKDRAAFAAEVQGVCSLYLSTPTLAAALTHVVFNACGQRGRVDREGGVGAGG